MPDMQAIDEAYQRGLLPDDQKAAYEELKRRGLQVGAPTASTSPTVVPKEPPPKTQELPSPPTKDIIEDVGRSIPTGLEKGLVGMVTAPPTLTQMAGAVGQQYLPSSVTQPVAKGAEWAREHIPGSGLLLNPKFTYPAVQSYLEQNQSAGGTPLYQPKTGYGEAAETGASFVMPLLAGAPETFPMRAVQTIGAAAGAAGGEALSRQSPLKDYLAPYAPAVEMVGALLGHKMMPKAITPFPVLNEYYGQQAKRLGEAGVDLTAGRKTGSPTLLQRESNLGPSVTKADQEKSQFSSAVLRELGATDARALPGTLRDLEGQFKTKYDMFYNNRRMNYDRGFIPSMDNLAALYHRTAGGQASPLVDEALNNMKFDLGTQGSGLRLSGMVGPRYQHTMEKLNDAISNAPDFQTKSTLIKMHDALEGQFRNSLPIPDRDTFDTLNKQYANWNVISGSKIPSDKYITPQSLAQAISSARGDKSFNLGRGTLAGLAHAGQEVLSDRPAPNKGLGMLQAPIDTAATYAGYRYGGPVEGATAGIMAHMLGSSYYPYIERLLRNPVTRAAYNAAPVRGLISNQLLTPKQPMTNTELFARVLANMGGQPSTPVIPPQQ